MVVVTEVVAGIYKETGIVEKKKYIRFKMDS